MNHACVAAAFELFAGFMKDVWDGADEAVACAFADEYIAGLVVEAAGAVEEETSARIFLDTLGELIAYDRVRIDGIGPSIERTKHGEVDRIVGRLEQINMPLLYGLDQDSDDRVILLSIPLARAAVQEHLRAQGRQQLQISERTLLDQFAPLGVLLDPDNQPIMEGQEGKRTHKTRIGGRSVKAARIRRRVLRVGRSDNKDPQHQAAGTTEMTSILPFAETQ